MFFGLQAKKERKAKSVKKEQVLRDWNCSGFHLCVPRRHLSGALS
jgi:hypothetical protein